jgi:hypothetical protein
MILKIKHNGVEIEFSAEDLQQVAQKISEVAKPVTLKSTVAKPVRGRGRPKGSKSKPAVKIVPPIELAA